MFLGSYILRKDDNGRLVLPAKYRYELHSGIVITKGQGGCLYVFPREEFSRTMEALHTAAVTTEAIRDSSRELLASAYDELPDRQGRVRIPHSLRKYAGLRGDCIVIGANSRLEIWDYNAWNSYSAAGDIGVTHPAEEDARFPVDLPGHTFICYVREDAHRVDQLQGILERAGIRVWRDSANIWPGQDWRLAIRDAITAGSLVFLACFSANSQHRDRSYQNEELSLAVDQMRLRQPGMPWLIPVRFDACNLPPFGLGGGRMLDSLQCADLFGPGYQAQAERLVLSIQRILASH
jgi:division/cell wall cluster transcriptional repressor MraZ